ncbi:hypothetical protein GALMADRAFT_141310 [Galerina marginata CBS 339.88]|uniref:Uncharacterized protein n=1 Tax=Galerina marginata (strain CBS 339.88) TaxID=685588 RepID=A0A067STL0_GALM3|nr:hypothetical protein GALMADRAFT_141310 [Galerina marginata CBS 339.88]
MSNHAVPLDILPTTSSSTGNSRDGYLLHTDPTEAAHMLPTLSSRSSEDDFDRIYSRPMSIHRLLYHEDGGEERGVGRRRQPRREIGATRAASMTVQTGLWLSCFADNFPYSADYLNLVMRRRRLLTLTPCKHFGGIANFGAGAVAGGGMLSGDLAAGGTRSNPGKMGDAALADADRLDVNQNVNFGEIGGLDDHIHALKEMTLLPLLYPEVFQI